MATIFITGLSGTGKSTVLEELKIMGYNVVDTDYGYIKEEDYGEVVLDEEKITNLLEEYRDSHLFIAGIYSNQGKFYEHFDYVVLLKVELNVMLERINNRTSNNYGKSPEEVEKVIASYGSVLPILEGGADIVIDTSNNGVDSICKRLIDLL
ncbi:AAA family ATPase [Paenibacillus sp. GCM10028914]|uniref:AAA family ATPase n=1 Tax=Paenibacillus sp. GCM10028914 TaxID=3273416 RepID=UPI003609EF48